MRSLAILAAGCLTISGCQTATYRYEPFLQNAENLEVAYAKCQIASSSVEQGMVAWGSPLYVSSMQLANSIDNAARVDQFMQQCMTVQGWRTVVVEPQKVVENKSFLSGEDVEALKTKGINLLAMRHVLRECGAVLTSQARKDFDDLERSAPNDVSRKAKALAQQRLKEQAKRVGKAAACSSAKKASKGMIER